MKLLAHYQALADLFEYPDSEYPQRVGKLIDLLGSNYPEAVAELDRFLQLLPGRELRTMQELFTRSFDVQAITTLDIGYVLFGDDYKRGELLANLNREHRQLNNDCRRELADHLPNILRLLGKLKNNELRDELVQEIVFPALAKMISEFTPARIEKKYEPYKNHYKTLIEAPAAREEISTLYQFALTALYEVLKRDFSLKEKPVPESTCDFLQSVTRENEIESKATHSY
jgi:nitrate reductase assembly molybdenum cofactor insertion protein NarJ